MLSFWVVIGIWVLIIAGIIAKLAHLRYKARTWDQALVWRINQIRNQDWEAERPKYVVKADKWALKSIERKAKANGEENG